MNVYDLNKAAWDRAVGEGTNPYTQVVSPEEVAEARRGKWSLDLSGGGYPMSYPDDDSRARNGLIGGP